MNEKERVLQMALILMKHGEPLPVDLLARADALGIDVEELDQPHQHNFNNNNPAQQPRNCQCNNIDCWQ